MMTLISNTAKGQMHFMDAGQRSLANFGILEDTHIDDRFIKFPL